MEKYSKRSNKPFKRAFSRFKRKRMGFKMRNDFSSQYVNVKVEWYDTIMCASGSSVFQFNDTTVPQIGLSTIFSSSVSWQNIYTSFAMYKITGLSMQYYPTADVAYLRTLFSRASPGIACAFYPQYSNSNLGDAPKYQEHNFFFSPGVTTMSSKYLYFPTGYGSGMTNSVGVWNRTNDYGSLLGQISVCNSESGNTSSSPHNIAGIKFTIFVTLKSRNS